MTKVSRYKSLIWELVFEIMGSQGSTLRALKINITVSNVRGGGESCRNSLLI